jgi:hypothetical protein
VIDECWDGTTNLKIEFILQTFLIHFLCIVIPATAALPQLEIYTSSGMVS